MSRPWPGWPAVLLALGMLLVGCTSPQGRSQPVGAAPTAARPAAGDRPPWRLVFADEFNGSSLDRSEWTDCYWWDRHGCTNSGNDELQWYLPANIEQRDGALRLEARRKSVLGSDGKRYAFTSGMVTTGRATDSLRRPPRFAFQYGRVVARMRMPAGQGLWSALWLLPTSQRSRPEIDIVEILGDRPSRLLTHVHYRQDGQREDRGRAYAGEDSSTGYHRYAVTWTPQELSWSVDDKQIWQVTKPAAVPDEPMYLLMNLAVGGSYPGTPNGFTRFPSDLDVDYVRVYQRR